MAATKKKLRFPLLILILFLGVLIGSAFGHALGAILPEGLARSFLVEGLVWGIGPVTLDLVVVSVTLGFGIDINAMGVLGVLAVAQALKWY